MLLEAALLLPLLVLPSGCTGPVQWLRSGMRVGPDYRAPRPQTEADWRPRDSAVQSAACADLCAWWNVFDDDVLTELVETAARRNLDLRSAAERIRRSQCERQIALGGLLPQSQSLDGHYERRVKSFEKYSINVSHLGGSYDDWYSAFNLSWELDFWGRLRRAVDAADAELEAECFRFDEIMLLLQAEVASGYIDYRTFDSRFRLANKNAGLQAATVALIERRLAAGMSDELDLHQAKALLANTCSEIPRFEALREDARNRLAMLLDLPWTAVDARLHPGLEVPCAPPQVLIGLPGELIARRPDLRRAERELAAQCEKIGIAEAELYPHIAITGTIGLQAEFVDDYFKSPAQQGSIGPSFRWNILNYGRIVDNMRAQDAEFRARLYAYCQQTQRAQEEVQTSLCDFACEKVRQRELQTASEEFRRATELVMLRFERGMVDYERVYDIQRALVVAEESLAESQGEVALNLVRLYKAFGGGFGNDGPRAVPFPPVQ